MELIFATNNNHKIKEVKALLDSGIKLLGLSDANITEDIPEEGDTLEDNARFKAQFVYKKTGMNVFADDTGLEVEALHGAPGVHSARFAGEDKNSKSNIEKLLRLLKGEKNRKARFRTVIALIYDKNEYFFEGTVSGKIITSERGNEGFGYDPVFVADGCTNTFAEISLSDKNKISHRAEAFQKLQLFLNDRV